MRIGELESRTGVGRRLLRYYEEQGLLRPARDANGYRSYGEVHVDVVARIREFLGAGLGTETIREMVARTAEQEPDVLPCGRTLGVLDENLESLDSRIAELTRRRDRLAGIQTAVTSGARLGLSAFQDADDPSRRAYAEPDAFRHAVFEQD